MSKAISVTAAMHACRNLPISIPVKAVGKTVYTGLRDISNGNLMPAQVMEDCGQSSYCWILKDLPVGETREYEFISTKEVPDSEITLVETNSKIEFQINGDLFTTYHYGKEYARPFLYPVIGPGGKGVTRGYPIEPDVPGETKDHPHHKSIWVAHGDVNGADDWSELEGHASIIHRRFGETSSGPVFARLKALNDWVDNQGKKIMEEERIITVYNLPDTGRMIDFRIVFHTTECDVKFGDTKEGGILSVRVATSMDGNKGGLITNSFGGLTEAETWGKRAHWCDYSGLVDGRTMGITVFDHPGNFRYPTYWHIRDYGLMTANPFALSAYKNDASTDGGHVVKLGESFRFAYRVYVHDQSAEDGKVSEQYHGYVSPPAIALK